MALAATIGVGTAALVGIIIAAVLCCGGIAGCSIYGIMTGNTPGAGAVNNPLYRPGGNKQNPLFKV